MAVPGNERMHGQAQYQAAGCFRIGKSVKVANVGDRVGNGHRAINVVGRGKRARKPRPQENERGQGGDESTLTAFDGFDYGIDQVTLQKIQADRPVPLGRRVQPRREIEPAALHADHQDSGLDRLPQGA